MDVIIDSWFFFCEWRWHLSCSFQHILIVRVLDALALTRTMDLSGDGDDFSSAHGEGRVAGKECEVCHGSPAKVNTYGLFMGENCKLSLNSKLYSAHTDASDRAALLHMAEHSTEQFKGLVMAGRKRDGKRCQTARRETDEAVSVSPTLPASC